MPSRRTSAERDGRSVRRSLWVGALSLLFLLPKSYSLDPSRHISQYGHSIWRRQDGVVGATSQITQTTDGYIWITTPNGLARFDGVNFVPWVPPRDILFSWRHFNVLLGASDGSLWIGTASGFGRLKDGRFRSYSKPEERWGVSSIIEDHTGRIWLTRFRIPHDAGAICEALDQGLHCYGPADGVPLQYGLGLAEDSQGNFWIGSRNLCRWKPGSTCTIYLDKGAADAEIAAVASGPSQTVWIVNPPGPEGGLKLFSAGKLNPYSAQGFHASAIDSEAILADRDGSVWVGTETEGLYRIHNGVVDHYGPADGLSGHQVAEIYEDHEGNLWVTTDGGMDMFRNTPVISYSDREGLSRSFPSAILASRDGLIWIGANDGIDLLRDGRKQNLPAWLSRTQTLSVFEDHTGTIWFAERNDLVSWNHSQFHLLKQHHTGSHGRWITGITEDAQHNLWALSDTYLFEIVQRQLRQYIPLPKNFVHQGLLATDLQGGIWISDRASHVFRYSNGQFQTMELKDTDGANPAIQAMIADADDPLLVATLRGLFRWDGQRWTVLDAHNGLPCTRVVSIIKDAHGALWLGAEPCGFLRIDPSELAKWRHDAGAKVAVKVLDRLDGAYPGQKLTAEPYATRAPDGRIWFANGIEVETIDPDHLFQNSVLPPVHLSAVIADDKAYEPSSALRLPARTRNLEIDYTALSFSVPQKVRFRYKLEGHDTDWQNAGTRRQAFYTDLKPSNYTFRVIACNNDGLWNEQGATLSFAVAPAYFQTNWFRALCVAAFLALLWTAYQIRIRQLRQKFATVIDARVNERTRIARELHDTVLQSLHGLLMSFQRAANLLPERPVEAKQRLEAAIDQAARAVTEGREAVQGLRCSTVVTSNLAVAIQTLGEELAAKQSSENSPEFHVAVEGTQRDLNPMLQDDVYRIAVEAVRNAFQHAQARRIEVEIHYDDRQLRVRIRDDGNGVDVHVLREKAGHWGLPGMRERAKLVGGQLEIWSQPHSGTEIELRIPASIGYCASAERQSQERTG